jgi:ABC-type multidrug transport system permease subunit
MDAIVYFILTIIKYIGATIGIIVVWFGSQYVARVLASDSVAWKLFKSGAYSFTSIILTILILSFIVCSYILFLNNVGYTYHSP